MKYCKHCLQPDTRPNSKFTFDGICSACDYYDKLQFVDWLERYEILKDLIEEYKKKRRGKSYFDCIIGVSGGKDSTRQALWVRDKLGLNPLLACLSYPPEQVTQRGTNNISTLIELGFDVVITAPAPEIWRRLMRISFDKFTNWATSTELALFASVPQLAIHYDIPLILWGENPALQVGDLKTLGRTGYDGNNLRYGNTLSSGFLDSILELGFESKLLIPYQYPTTQDFDRHELQIVYLGWFLGDWSVINNGIYAAAVGLEIREDAVTNTGDLYGITSLDTNWVDFNQMIKYFKFGFGRITECVNEEIRLGRMTREEGIALVEQYDGACSANCIEDFSDYIGISTSQFWAKVRDSVNRELFDVRADGQITRKFKVGIGL